MLGMISLGLDVLGMVLVPGTVSLGLDVLGIVLIGVLCCDVSVVVQLVSDVSAVVPVVGLNPFSRFS